MSQDKKIEKIKESLVSIYAAIQSIETGNVCDPITPEGKIITAELPALTKIAKRLDIALSLAMSHR